MLLSSARELCDMAAECDNLRPRGPWGRSKTGGITDFDTAKEAEFPLLFCKRYTWRLLVYAGRVGFQVQADAEPGAQAVPSESL